MNWRLLLCQRWGRVSTFLFSPRTPTSADLCRPVHPCLCLCEFLCTLIILVQWAFFFFFNDSLVLFGFGFVCFLFVCLLACLLDCFFCWLFGVCLIFFFFLLFVFVFVLHVCLYEGVRSPGTTVTDICELPCGFWKLNQGPPEEQPVLLASEPSLQPPRGGCFSWCPLSSLDVIVFLFPLSQCSWAPRGGVW